MKRVLILFFVLLFFSHNLFSEVRLGIETSDKFYIMEDPEQNYDFFYLNFVQIAPKIDFTIFRNFEGTVGYEFSFLTDTKGKETAGILTTGFKYSIQFDNQIFLRPLIGFGILGFFNYSGPLLTTIPGVGPFFEVGLEIAKQFQICEQPFEFSSSLLWRKELALYSPIVINLGIKYILM